MKRHWVLLVAVLAGCSACGSRLSRAELERSNGVLQLPAPDQGGSAALVAATTAPGSAAVALPRESGASPHARAAGATGVSPPGAPHPSIPGPSAARSPGGRATGAGPAPAAGSEGGPGPQAHGSGETPIGGADAVPALAQPGQPIVLGSVGTESGLLGGALAPALAAARAWVGDVNARGGIGGRPVRVIFGDDGGNPNQALSLVRRMVEQDKVEAFYAFRMPTTMEAVVAYLDKAKVPVIGTCVCDTSFGRSEMVFNPGGVSGLTGLVWEHILPVSSQTDKRKAALFSCREASVCTALADGVAELAPKAGLTIAYRGQMSIAQPDFTAEMISARNAGADIVIAVSENATLIRMARSAHRQDYRPLFVGTHSSHQDSFIASGGEDVEGAVVAASVPEYGTSPKLADYRAAMGRFAPGAPRGSLGAQAWVAGKMIEHLVGLIGDRPVEPASFVDALYSLRGETLGGLLPPTTYVPGQGHDLTAQCVVGLVIQGGRYVAPRGDDYVCAPGWRPVQR